MRRQLSRPKLSRLGESGEMLNSSSSWSYVDKGGRGRGRPGPKNQFRENEKGEREGELLVVPLLHHYLRKRSYYAWDGDFGGGGGRWTKTLFGYRRCAAASLPYSLQ